MKQTSAGASMYHPACTRHAEGIKCYVSKLYILKCIADIAPKIVYNSSLVQPDMDPATRQAGLDYDNN